MGFTLLPHTNRYYVDATLGNDANTGTNAGDPWQTIGKINGYTFERNDEIYLKRGETWVGTSLVAPRSNLAFKAYGTGVRPIIDGNDLVDCVTAANKSDLLYKDIEATQGFDFGFAFNTCSSVVVINCDAHDCGNDNLLFDTCDQCEVRGGKFYAAYRRVAGPELSGIEMTDGSDNIVIDGVECYGQIDGGHGIVINSHVATRYPTNITIKNSYCHNNAGAGIRGLKQDATADSNRNIVIENNRLNSNTLDGIWLSTTTAEYINGFIIRDNEIDENARRALFLIADGLSIYRNLITSTVNTTLIYMSDCREMEFYNNTMYVTFVGNSPFMSLAGARTQNFEVLNNILFADNTGPYLIQVAAATGVVGMDIDYNLYRPSGALNRWLWLGVVKNWASWLTDSGQDANSPVPADPTFVNPGAGDFTLQAGSPAIDAGIDVGLPYLGTAPDCGYAERE